jgi:hypothetical protein
MKTKICLMTLLCLVLIVWTSGVQAAAVGEGSWVQVSLGLHGMAMDDINKTDFRWHEDSANGFDLKELSSGMALSFGIGYDMSPALGYGFFWEHQYAKTDGQDQEIKADVNLGANIFAGRVNYNFIRSEKWRLGLAGSLGYLATSGNVKISTDGVNYGDTAIKGSGWSLEGMAIVEFVAGESTIVQVTGGWRQAEVKSFKNGGATAKLPDGSDMTLDYTGFTARVGLKYRFGNLDEQVTHDIN